MPDDYSAPLGLDRIAPPRRRLPIWPFLAGPTLIILAGLAAFAVLNPDPYGGQPHVAVDLPPVPPPQPVAAPEQPAAEPDDPDGQIIIRDP